MSSITFGYCRSCSEKSLTQELTQKFARFAGFPTPAQVVRKDETYIAAFYEHSADAAVSDSAEDFGNSGL